METKHKNALIGGLLAIVFVMAVGYAAFATQLNINGTANVTSTWDVHIQSIEALTPATGSATSKSANLVDGNPLAAEFVSELVAPGDSITYKVVVENGGTLPAKLTNIKFTNSQGDSAIPDTTEGSSITDTRTIIYSYDGIAVNDVLAPTGSEGSTKEFTVTVTYNPQITSQPAEAAKTATLDMQLTYEQNK